MTNQASNNPADETVVDSGDNAAPAAAPAPGSAGEGAAETHARDLIANLEREKTELYDRLLRKQAELENFRKRVDRERGEWYHQGVVDLVKEFLSVMDACERALASFKTVPDNPNAVDTYRSGVELIYRQVKNVMQRFGVTEIEALGGQFNPNLHEAIANVETDEHEENRVVEEVQKGYMHREKLLRPAVVKVSAPGRREERKARSEERGPKS